MNKEQIKTIEGKLKTAQGFDRILTGVTRFDLIAGVGLFVVSGRPLEVGVGMIGTLLVYSALNVRNERRMDQLKNDLEVEKAGDYAQLLYPNTRNGWIENEGEMALNRARSRSGPAH